MFNFELKSAICADFWFCLGFIVIVIVTAMELREKVTLMDNLPKIPADKQIAQLRAIY